MKQKNAALVRAKKNFEKKCWFLLHRKIKLKAHRMFQAKKSKIMYQKVPSDFENMSVYSDKEYTDKEIISQYDTGNEIKVGNYW